MHGLRLACVLVFLSAAIGCRSPYHSDRLALFGGLTGAGVGAAIGNASGNPAAGAVIGSAVGALSGAVVGDHLDEVEARNQAVFEAQLGRRLTGSVTNDDIIALTHAHVGDDVIVSHIRAYGVARVPSASDLIYLKQQGVSDAVLRAMQQPPEAPRPVVVQPAPVPVIVEEYHYGPPPPHWYYRYHHRRPPPRSGVSWGVTFSN